MAAKEDWKFVQCFGEKTNTADLNNADIISSVEFDQTGEYLATGDKGGRIVIFEQTQPEKGSMLGKKRGVEYKFYAEFQSHEQEFDYLKSLEIEEKINRIRWCHRSNNSLYLLSTNDKTIKLWKIYEKRLKAVSQLNISQAKGGSTVSSNSLRIPRITTSGSVLSAYPRRIFANAHAYHINSISPNSDGECFISTDDLRINLWNLERPDSCFNIVDIKPENMEELTEVITVSEFHPRSCNLFIYGSSRGTLKLGDLRQTALCDQYTKLFEEEVGDPTMKGFFSEIVSSISDVKFTSDGRYIVSRDYMTVKLWDLNMEKKPVATYKVHDHLTPKLPDLYENDYIFDKFEVSVGMNNEYFITGSYDSTFHIFSRDESVHKIIEATATPTKINKSNNKRKGKTDYDPSIDAIDFNRRCLQLSCHPQSPSVAIGGQNCLFIYSAV